MKFTKEQLQANYKTFDDFTIARIAADPSTLTPLALEVLREEIQRRGLDLEIQLKVEEEQEVDEVPIDIYDSSLPLFQEGYSDDQPLAEEEYTNEKIFKSESFTMKRIGVGFFLLGLMLTLVPLSFLDSEPNDTGLYAIAAGGFLVVIVAGFIFNSSGKSMLAIYPDRVVFQTRIFPAGSRASLIDILRLVFSPRKTVILKQDIKAINRPTEFLRTSVLHFEMKNGDIHEINFVAHSHELNVIVNYVNKYLEAPNEEDWALPT